MFPTLSDEQRRFVSTVRELAQSEFRERAQRYMDGTFPWENMKPLAQMGILGMAVPEEYGGAGPPGFGYPPLPAGNAQTRLASPAAGFGWGVRRDPHTSPPQPGAHQAGA